MKPQPQPQTLKTSSRIVGVNGWSSLSIFLSLSVEPLAAAAQPFPPGVDASTQQITVTALRTPAPVSTTVAEVTVLSREDLDQATGLTLTQLLAMQPGLQTASNGGPGQFSALYIRGLEARHTLLLVDGVRVGSATLGLPSFDNLPLSLVDHVEIVRGPMSSLYGADAVGGVVQIFTRRARPGTALVGEASVGAGGYAQGMAGVRYTQGDFDIGLYAQHTENSGFSATNAKVPWGNYNPDRDGFNQNSVNVRIGWQAGPDWRLDAFTFSTAGDTQYDDGPQASASARLVNRVQAFKLTGQLSPAWQTAVSASRSTDAYITQSSAQPETSLGAVQTVQQQFSWDNTFTVPFGTLLTVLDTLSQKVSQPDTPFDVSTRTIYGGALALNSQAGSHDWQLSLRRDHNSQFGDQTTGAAAWGYAVSPQWRVGASYGTSFVAPSFNQLYYPGYGSPDLQPERGRSVELNARWHSAGHAFHASWYRNRIRGFITSGPQAANVALAQIEGVTLTYETRWHQLGLRASIDHLDPRNQSPGSALDGKILPRRAQNALKADALWSFGSTTAGLAWSAYSHRYDDANNTIRLGGYGLVDLLIEHPLSRDCSLTARLNNVGGKVYETAYGYNQPGREFYLALRYAPK